MLRENNKLFVSFGGPDPRRRHTFSRLCLFLLKAPVFGRKRKLNGKLSGSC